MSLRLKPPHFHISLQGMPRRGRRRFGVPPGGAFDREAWLRANRLAGNLEVTPALEIAFHGLVAQVEQPCRLALIGSRANLDGLPMLTAVFHAVTGQVLEISQPFGARAYLAVAGGWTAIGPDRFAISNSPTHEPESRTAVFARTEGAFPYVPSGDAPHLDGKMLSVTSRLDRVGIRLEGAHGFEVRNVVSEPTCFGAIQATRGGLIVLGPDGPTVGGYPPLGVVCAAALDRLAQLRPGDGLTFESVTLDEGRGLRRAHLNRLKELAGASAFL